MALSSIIGWVGSILIVVAFFLVSTGRVKGNNRTYQLMNLVGAIGIGTNVFVQEAWPALFVQVVWAGVALTGLYQSRRSK